MLTNTLYLIVKYYYYNPDKLLLLFQLLERMSHNMNYCMTPVLAISRMFVQTLPTTIEKLSKFNKNDLELFTLLAHIRFTLS